MKKLFFLAIFLIPFISCSKLNEPTCQTCTGTVTNSGEMANWTVCDDDGTLTQTNNQNGESMVSENTLAESVAYFESIGLNCK